MGIEDFWKKHSKLAGGMVAAGMMLFGGRASAEEKPTTPTPDAVTAATSVPVKSATTPSKAPTRSNVDLPQRGDMGISPDMPPDTPHWKLVPQPGRDPDLAKPPAPAHKLSKKMVEAREKEAADYRKTHPKEAQQNMRMAQAMRDYYKQGNAGFDLEHLNDMPTCEELNAPLKMAHPEAAVKAVKEGLEALGTDPDAVKAATAGVEQAIDEMNRQQADCPAPEKSESAKKTEPVKKQAPKSRSK